MIIVNILGGLGNQMFQYAFARAISVINKKKLKLDITIFEDYDLRQYELALFNIDADIATKQELKNFKYNESSFLGKIAQKLCQRGLLFNNKIYKEKYFHYDHDVTKIKNSMYFSGYWQSEKYFLDCKNIILQDFTLKQQLSYKSQHYKQAINSKMAVSLHIRRGDYVSNTVTNNYHGTCSLAYYKKAVLLLKEKIENPSFFIFSDDLLWARENLDFINDMTFIDLDKSIPDHEEMHLMSQCKHNIIANSSFSWWGAWLNENSDKIVIAPKKWFRDNTINTEDLIPAKWMRI